MSEFGFEVWVVFVKLLNDPGRTILAVAPLELEDPDLTAFQVWFYLPVQLSGNQSAGPAIAPNWCTRPGRGSDSY